MHTSVKVDVFLSTAPNPIVEDCHDIRFTSYPQTLLASERSGEAVRGGFEATLSSSKFVQMARTGGRKPKKLAEISNARRL